MRSVLRFGSGFHPTRPRGKDDECPLAKLRLMQLPSPRGCLRQAPQGTCTPNHFTMPSALAELTLDNRMLKHIAEGNW